MTSRLEELGRRAVACSSWRWMAGMAAMRQDDDTLVDKQSKLSFEASEIRVTTTAFEVCEPEHRFVDVSLLLNGKTRSYGSIFTRHLIPDLSDPATLGCLLALVREAWGKPDLHTRPEGSRWRMWSFEWPSSMLHPTEVEALVAALEAAQ